MEKTEKTYFDYSIEELDNMDPEKVADMEAQAFVEALNNPENHDKTH